MVRLTKICQSPRQVTDRDSLPARNESPVLYIQNRTLLLKIEFIEMKVLELISRSDEKLSKIDHCHSEVREEGKRG